MTKRLTEQKCSLLFSYFDCGYDKKYMCEIAQMFQVEIQGYTYVKIDCV